MSPKRNMNDIKVERFFFLKFVQTNLHGGKTWVFVMFQCLLMCIATMLNNLSVFLSWDTLIMLTGRNHVGTWADFLVNCLTGYKSASMWIFFKSYIRSVNTLSNPDQIWNLIYKLGKMSVGSQMSPGNIWYSTKRDDIWCQKFQKYLRCG